MKSIRDMICWQYAKILSGEEGFGKNNYGYIAKKFKQLKEGELDLKSSAKKILSEKEDTEHCAYCGKHAPLARTFLIPATRGGPDTEDNQVMACTQCRLNKGDKRLYEWYGIDSRDILPTLAETKYLLVLYQHHEKKGTLNITDIPKLCLRCDMEPLCPEKQVLSVYCLEGSFLKK